MATPRSRSLATALLTARSLTAALPPSYATRRDVTRFAEDCLARKGLQFPGQIEAKAGRH
jgi:hypothetical protein